MKHDPDCDELADILGITASSSAVPMDKPLDDPTHKRLSELVTRLAYSDELQADFAARYLLALTHHIKELYQHGPTPYLQLVFDWVTLSTSPGGSLSLHRLLRKHVDRIPSLRSRSISRLQQDIWETDQAVSVSLRDKTLVALAGSTRNFARLHWAIRCSAPSGTTWPLYLPKQYEMLTRLTTWLESDTTLRAQWSDPMDIRWYIEVVRNASLEAPDAPSQPREPALPWWRCQRRSLLEDDEDGWISGDCATFDGEILLDACSRCLCVRYCSIEHQTEDWPRHKLVCFKPLW